VVLLVGARAQLSLQLLVLLQASFDHLYELLGVPRDEELLRALQELVGEGYGWVLTL